MNGRISPNFQKGIQGSTDGRLGPNFKRVRRRDPRTPETIRILKADAAIHEWLNQLEFGGSQTLSLKNQKVQKIYIFLGFRFLKNRLIICF